MTNNQLRKKLLWRSKRGLLELDIILSNFIKNDIYLTDEELNTLDKILDMNDHDLLNQINGITIPDNYKFHQLMQKIKLFSNKSRI